MAGSALIEMFGRIILGFTRNVAENYNPNEVGFGLKAVGFNSLELTGSEWNFHSVDELIFEEHGDNQVKGCTVHRQGL